MKKTWMTIALALFGSFAQAADRVVLSTETIHGVEVSITAEAPVKNGGGIAFKNARAEVNGQTLRIVTRSLYQLWSESSPCANQEFKNLYLTAETASGEKTLNMVSGEVVDSENLAMVKNIVCMEQPY